MSEALRVATFCAICTEPGTSFSQRPLGRNDALVPVCSACDTQPARTKRGPERGYDADAAGVSLARISRACDRILLEAKTLAQAERAAERVVLARNGALLHAIKPLTPGWLLVRVPLRRGGVQADANEAYQSLRDKPWHSQLRHLGTTTRWHLFERPDDAAARAAQAPGPSGVGELERFRAGTPTPVETRPTKG